MRHLCADSGLEVHIESAGTGDWHAGDPPDARAMDAARRAGFDISSQRARQLRPDDFDRFEYILAMDGNNLAALQARQPDIVPAKISLLLDFADGRANGQSVPDPYYGSTQDFDKTVALVRSGCAGLLTHLKG